MQENEDSLEDWAESLTELSTMKTDLSQYIIADDVLLLQEQVEHLHCQWEELCLKVSLRDAASPPTTTPPLPPLLTSERGRPRGSFSRRDVVLPAGHLFEPRCFR